MARATYLRTLLMSARAPPRMVRATKLGKERPWVRGFVLTVITFGIYGIYWLYKAHDEVFKQFEMDNEGRDEGIVWLILGLVFSPLIYVYQWMFVSNVNWVEHRLGLKARITPGQFIMLVIVPSLVVAAGSIVLFTSEMDPDTGMPTEVGEPQAMVGAAIIGLGAVLTLLLVVTAYAKLQNSINDVWAAYDARMAQLKQSEPGTPGSDVEAAAKPAAPAWAAGASARADAVDAPGAGLESDAGDEEE